MTLVMSGLLLTSLMSMLDQSITATAGPAIVGDLGGLGAYSWAFTAYMLAFSVAMPLWGKLGDLFGRKRIYLISIAVFLTGSAACGGAQTMSQLIAFRAVQGVGGGAFMVMSMAVIGDMFAPQARAKYQGYFAAVFALANLAGPLVGGVVADQLGWRWVFFVNLPIGLVALVLLSVLLTGGTVVRRRIDVGGAILLTGVVVSLVLLTNWAGTQYGWSSPVILGLGGALVVLFPVWVFVERRAAEPIVPIRPFHDASFRGAVIIAFVGSFAFFGCINFVPLFFELVAGSSATRTGLLFIPAMLAVGAASLLAGRRIAATGRYKWFPVASMAIALVGMALLATIDAGTPVLLAGGYLALVGFGIGLSQQVVTLIAQNTAPRKDMGAVTATVGFMRNTGVWFGTAVCGAVLNGQLAAALTRNAAAQGLAGVHTATLSPARVATLDPTTRHALATAYAHSLGAGFAITVPGLLIGLVAALLLKNVPLQRRGPGGPGGSGGPGAPGAPVHADGRPGVESVSTGRGEHGAELAGGPSRGEGS